MPNLIDPAINSLVSGLLQDMQEDSGFGHKKAKRSKKKRKCGEIMSTVGEKGVELEPEATPNPAEPTCSEDEAEAVKAYAGKYVPIW